MEDSLNGSDAPAQRTRDASGLKKDAPPDAPQRQRAEPEIRLFPPRPNGWIKGFSILFGLASVGVWLLLSQSLQAAQDMPTALAATMAAMVALYHAGYFISPFLVGRGVWQSVLGLLIWAPAAFGWVILYVPAMAQAPTPVKAVGAGCLGALVMLGVIGLRQIVQSALRRGGQDPEQTAP